MYDDDDALPRQLDRDLKRLYSPRVHVPPAVDQAVLGRFRQRVTIRLASRWRRIAAASVAASLLVGFGWLAGLAPFAPTNSARRSPYDVDRDGCVDIVDAYVLALALEQGTSVDFDVNEDGRTDRRDVDRIGEYVVRSRREASSR